MTHTRQPIEQKIIKAHITQRENTMDYVTRCSAGMSLRRLYERYPIAKQATDSLFDKTITAIKKMASSEKLNAIDSFISLANQPLSRLDQATLYLPRDNNKSNHSGFTKEEQTFPLKEVLILTWRAASDAATAHYNTETVKFRQQSFINALVDIKHNSLCHIGTRHELIASLNHVHPDVHFIVSGAEFALGFYRNLLLNALIEKNKFFSLPKMTLITWLETGDATSLFIEFGIAEKAEEMLIQEFIQHGCDPADDNVVALLSLANIPFFNGMNELKDIPLTPLHTLLTMSFPSMPDTSKENSALKQVVTWIKHEFNFNDPEHHQLLLQHYHFFNALFLLLQHKELLVLLPNETTIKSCQELTASYLQHILAKTPLPILHSNDIKLIQELKTIIDKGHNSHPVEFITNFFALWEENDANKKIIYQRLLNQHILNAIFIARKEVCSWLALNAIDASMTPYQINRIFLHSLFTPETEWSSEFGLIFKITLAFVKKRSRQLHEDSYSRILLQQLDYLLKNYQYCISPDTTENKPTRPDTFFTFNPKNIRTIDQWVEFSKLASEEQRARYFNILQGILIKDCKYEFLNSTINHPFRPRAEYGSFGHFVNSIPTSQRVIFFIKASAFAPVLPYLVVYRQQKLIDDILTSPLCSKTILEQTTSDGWNVLMLATACVYTDTINLLLKLPYCTATFLEKKDRNGQNVLMLAARYGLADLVKLLIAFKYCTPDVFAEKDNEGLNALMLAAKNNHSEVVKLLLSTVHSTSHYFYETNSKYLNTAIQTTIHFYNLVSEFLWEPTHCTKDFFTAQDYNGRNALIWAARENNVKIVVLLLASTHCTADFFAEKDDKGKNALMSATCIGNIDVVKALLASSHCTAIFLAEKNTSGEDALMLAKKYRHNNIATEISAAKQKFQPKKIVGMFDISPVDTHISDEISRDWSFRH